MKPLYVPVSYHMKYKPLYQDNNIGKIRQDVPYKDDPNEYYLANMCWSPTDQ